jgi:hypothetical protein
MAPRTEEESEGKALIMQRTKKFHTYIPEEDNVDYRGIAETMTDIGFPMQHSTVRNWTLRILEKFAAATCEGYDIAAGPEKIKSIAKAPAFQRSVHDILNIIEAERRASRHT